MNGRNVIVTHPEQQARACRSKFIIPHRFIFHQSGASFKCNTLLKVKILTFVLSAIWLIACVMDNRKKRMLFRAWHRGFKEMDLILGNFADRRLALLNDVELDQFEAVLEEEDGPLYHWITGKSAMPEALNTPLMREICDFTPLARSLGEGPGA
jgi:antitoxin CptB